MLEQPRSEPNPARIGYIIGSIVGGVLMLVIVVGGIGFGIYAAVNASGQERKPRKKKRRIDPED